jgi:hypothetical protein
VRALKENPLTKESIQLLISRGGEFQAHIIAGIQVLSVSNQYAKEEVASTYTYPPEYKGPRPIAEQIQEMAKLFGLDPSHAFAYAEHLLALPAGAEGWFAVPKWEAIAPTYGQAVELVLSKLGSSRKFINYREGKLGPQFLRQNAKTAEMFRKLGNEQPGDILIVAAQLGLHHRGKSVRRAREVFAANEVGLDPIACGCILRTHPAREVRWEQLHMDCAGVEYSPDADGSFPCVLGFYCNGSDLKFHCDWDSNANRDFGSASAFVPQ